MMLLQLFLEFARTGLFAVGGGLATLPFLYSLSDKTNWFSHEQLILLRSVCPKTLPGSSAGNHDNIFICFFHHTILQNLNIQRFIVITGCRSHLQSLRWHDRHMERIPDGRLWLPERISHDPSSEYVPAVHPHYDLKDTEAFFPDPNKTRAFLKTPQNHTQSRIWDDPE